MYVLCWMPVKTADMHRRLANGSHTDYDILSTSEHVIELFRSSIFTDNGYSYHDFDWAFDGDSWSTQMIVWDGSGTEEPGNFAICYDPDA